MQAGIRKRWRFIGQVLPIGTKPLIKGVGVVLICVPGSLLAIFLDDFWLGAFIVTLFMGLALGEGMFRVWEHTSTELAQARATEPPSLADRLHALYDEGVHARQKVETDPDWGRVHTHSGIANWTQTVMATLQQEVPGLALWFDQMQSPSSRTFAGPDPKKQHLSQFDWALDRLAEIEGVVRAHEPGGHLDGLPGRTQKLLFLEKSLHILQELQLLHSQIPPAMPGLETMDVDTANRRINECSEQAQSLLEGALNAQSLDAVMPDPPPTIRVTLRHGLDAENVQKMFAQEHAIRNALASFDTLAIAPNANEVLSAVGS